MKYAEIFNKAKEFGACDEKGLSIIESSKSISELIALLKSPQGVEFCMKNMFPTPELLSKYKIQLSKENVFVHDSPTLKNPFKVVVFGGEVNIEVDGYNVCEVYATSGALVNIKAKDHSFISVELHHGSKIGFNDVIDFAIVKEFVR